MGPLSPPPTKHRPLPSVDLALLPHELRAVRARQAALMGLAIVVVVGGAAVAFGADVWTAMREAAERPAVAPEEDAWPSEGGPQPQTAASPGTPQPEPPNEAEAAAAATEEAAEEEPAPQAAEAPAGTGEATRKVVRFGKSTRFRDAVMQAGTTGAEADLLVTALKHGSFDFRRCRPEHEMTLERGADGTLTSFEYRVDVTESFVARRISPDEFKAERVEASIDRRRVARGGRIAGSLGHAIEALGLGRSLTGAFVEAFEGKLNFTKHTRSGDEFRIIAEEEYVEGELLGYGTVHAVEYNGERAKNAQAFWFEPPRGRAEFFDESGRALHGGWLRTPLRYDHISSGYDLRRRHPVLKRIVPHHGVDYAAAPGTPVWAAADGIVKFAGYRGANGNLVAIKHARGFETFYAHLSRISRGIKAGTRVTQRQPIGTVGSTGRSTGPHLHFALKRNGRFLNPTKHLNGPGRPLPTSTMPRFKEQVRRLKRELAAIKLADAPSPESDAQPSGATEHFDEGPLDL
jgi:murein DD-endopeptidase MepM/ murein hydrolase activator NlpD